MRRLAMVYPVLTRAAKSSPALATVGASNYPFLAIGELCRIDFKTGP
jgi:hypothetical protein